MTEPGLTPPGGIHRDQPEGPSPSPPRPVIRISQKNIWIASLAGVVLLAVGVWLVVAMLPGFLSAPETRTAGEAPPAAADARKIQATLFRLSSDGNELETTSQEVLYGATAAEQARRIVEALVQPPPAGRLSPIPNG